MDDKFDFLVRHIGSNLFDQQTDFLLARFNACTRAIPST